MPYNKINNEGYLYWDGSTFYEGTLCDIEGGKIQVQYK